jgi:hypothetical protein
MTNYLAFNQIHDKFGDVCGMAAMLSNRRAAENIDTTASTRASNFLMEWTSSSATPEATYESIQDSGEVH